jgi:hypothetical protein
MKSWWPIKVREKTISIKRAMSVRLSCLLLLISLIVSALSKASRSVAETLKSFKFFVVGSKQTDEERDIGRLRLFVR